MLVAGQREMKEDNRKCSRCSKKEKVRKQKRKGRRWGGGIWEKVEGDSRWKKKGKKNRAG